MGTNTVFDEGDFSCVSTAAVCTLSTSTTLAPRSYFGLPFTPIDTSKAAGTNPHPLDKYVDGAGRQFGRKKRLRAFSEKTK